MRLVIMALLALTTPVLAQEVTPGQVLNAAVDGVIRPVMDDLKSQADGLEMAMAALCQTPSAAMLDSAAQQFGLAVAAHGRAEIFRIGPLMEDNNADRLLFWPDRRGIGLRQVQAVLAEEDESATSTATLRTKSIAVQGFGALEFVLFGTGAEALESADGAFRCRYGEAISGNIAMIAGELAQGWYREGGVADHLTLPRPDYDDYRTETEAMEALVGLAAHGLENVRDTRINPFIASGDGAAKPKQALYWRSGLTMAAIRSNLEAIERLIGASGMARAVGEANIGLGDSISFEFRNAYRALDLITAPVEQAVEDSAQARALAYLLIVVNSLHDMAGEQLPTALGLSVGFSSLDGD